MPINTKIHGSPAAIYAASDWLRNNIIGAVAEAADHVLGARNQAASGWEGKASEAFNAKLTTGGKETDEFEEGVTNSWQVGEKAATQLQQAQDAMARIKAEAAAAGLKVDGDVIMEPAAAPAQPEPAPQGADATPEAAKAHGDAMAAQAEHAQQQAAFDKARVDADNVVRVWRQQIEAASSAWEGQKQKIAFTAAGLGVTGGTAAMTVKKSPFMKQANLQRQNAEAMKQWALKIAQTDPVGFYEYSPKVIGTAIAGDKEAMRVGKLASKVGNVGGGALALGGIAYDIANGKPVMQAAVAGGSSFAASAATGAAVGTVFGGPLGTALGAGAGVVVGAFTSGAVNSWFEKGASHAVGDGIRSVEETGTATVQAGKDVASAAGHGLKNAWNAIF